MKKIALTLVFILIAAAGVFAQAQKSLKKRINAGRKSSVAAKTSEPRREKFNPARNPAADLQAAVLRAQKENKRIILDVGGEWCIWCVKMDVYFLENKALARFRDDNFIWLKVNYSPENENREFLAKFPAVEGYPHLFVLETDGSLLHSQGTAELEEQNQIIMTKPGESVAGIARKDRERSYDIVKFVEFLKRWSAQ